MKKIYILRTGTRRLVETRACFAYNAHCLSIPLLRKNARKIIQLGLDVSKIPTTLPPLHCVWRLGPKLQEQSRASPLFLSGKTSGILQISLDHSRAFELGCFVLFKLWFCPVEAALRWMVVWVSDWMRRWSQLNIAAQSRSVFFLLKGSRRRGHLFD